MRPIVRRFAQRVKCLVGWEQKPQPSASPAHWKQSLELFFAVRADEVDGVPTLEDHIYISGRELRLWTQPEMIEELVGSILDQAGMNGTSSVLEVGCASGFIARVLAPRVARYTGVDLAEPALRVAERLQLPNAKFHRSDGGRLPFADGSFDAAICFDVFTNFPRFAYGAGIIEEMVRAVRPGCRALVGSVPDAGKQAAYEARVREVTQDLEEKYGPVLSRPGSTISAATTVSVKPGVVCYYFAREDFITLGRRLGVDTTVVDIHKRNPYFGLRFNVIYQKPKA